MSQTSDTMELREDDIVKHYDAATAMVQGFDHTPRIAATKEAPAPEKSSGIGTRRRFRTTTPGLVTRRTTRSEGVQLLARIEGADEGDALISPAQATVLHALRRAIAVSLAVSEQYADRTGLADLKRANLEGTLPAGKKAEFGELLTAEAMVNLSVFGNAAAFLLAPHAGEETVEVGEVEEVLTDNGTLALHGALWELDQDIGLFAETESKLVATVLAFAEALMSKVEARASNIGRLEPFADASWTIEEDGLTIHGFTPSRAAKSSKLTMSFKKPNEVVGNHIAKYQAMKLAKMVMALSLIHI